MVFEIGFYEGLEEAAKNGMEKMYIGDLFSKWVRQATQRLYI